MTSRSLEEQEVILQHAEAADLRAEDELCALPPRAQTQPVSTNMLQVKVGSQRHWSSSLLK